MATTTKKKTTSSSVHQYVSTKPNTSLPTYEQQTYSSTTFNKDMPYSYKPNTVTANVYDGPTFQAQEYKSNYTPQNYQNNYTPGQYQSNYKPTEFNDTYKPGQYQSQYLPKIESALNNVTNWNYDPMQDASYQALAKVYGARGNLAAKSTLADAAMLNGGYGTSNAVSAAQQARNQYNQELAAYIPQLEQAAYQRAQGNLDALMGMDNTLYGRFSDDQSRQLAAKQFGLDVAGYNEGNRQFAEQNAQNVFNINEAGRQFAAQMGLDYDKLNQAEKQFVEQNAQNVWSMNRDDNYRAVQNAMDIFGMNEANRQWADTYNQNENQYAYDSKWQRYNAKDQNRQFVAGLNQNERQFGFNAGMDAAQLANDYFQWANNYNSGLYEWNKAQEEKGKPGGGGGRGRSGGGGAGYTSGSSSQTNSDAMPITEEDFKKLQKKKSTGKTGGAGGGHSVKTNKVMMTK